MTSASCCMSWQAWSESIIRLHSRGRQGARGSDIFCNTSGIWPRYTRPRRLPLRFHTATVALLFDPSVLSSLASFKLIHFFSNEIIVVALLFCILYTLVYL
jgi:hypothetical protein